MLICCQWHRMDISRKYSWFAGLCHRPNKKSPENWHSLCMTWNSQNINTAWTSHHLGHIGTCLDHFPRILTVTPEAHSTLTNEKSDLKLCSSWRGHGATDTCRGAAADHDNPQGKHPTNAVKIKENKENSNTVSVRHLTLKDTTYRGDRSGSSIQGCSG